MGNIMNKFLIFSSLLVLNLSCLAAARKSTTSTSQEILRRSDDGKVFFKGSKQISMRDYLLEQNSLALNRTPKPEEPSFIESLLFSKSKYDYFLNDVLVTKKEYRLAEKINAAKMAKWNLTMAAGTPGTSTETVLRLKKALDKAVRDIK